METPTLIDRFGRKHTYLRISVTDRCNLRCIYCMPHGGIAWREREELLTLEEIVRVAACLVRFGISKVRLTGGEPTVRSGLEWLIAKLAELPGLRTIGMTTNGLTLRNKARQLKDNGLTALNVSLDSLRPDRFSQLTGQQRLNDVLSGIDAALAAGFVPLKLNVVVMAGVNDDEILDFIAFVMDKPINVRFIEFMPSLKNGWSRERVVPFYVLKKRIEQSLELLPLPKQNHSTAKDFRIRGYMGTISFITSMSAEFCDGCNRLRLAADGSLKTCLFRRPELNLRPLLRSDSSDEAIAAAVRQVLGSKWERHPGMESLASCDTQTMSQVGG